MSLTIKTDDVTSGRRDVDLHGRLWAACANGLMEKKTNAIIPCQNHRFVVPNWTKKCFACDLIFTIPFVSSFGKQEKLKRYAAINISSINNLIKKNTAITCKT